MFVCYFFNEKMKYCKKAIEMIFRGCLVQHKSCVNPN